MPIDNNPLRQFFRRPAIYVKLPSGGKIYPPGVVTLPENEELAVYPMTAIDEITAKTPDALYNGTAVADIIKSCVPDIKDPWSINSVDLDALLIAIRTATDGNQMEINTACPACNEEAKYGLNLIGCLGQINYNVYSKEMSINGLTIKFRPMDYKQINEVSIKQNEIQRLFVVIDELKDVTEKTKKTREAVLLITDLTIFALSKTIEFIKTPNAIVTENEYILDFLRNCDKAVYEAVKDTQAEIKKNTEMKPLHIKCIHCSHEYDQPFTLNMSDFFG